MRRCKSKEKVRELRDLLMIDMMALHGLRTIEVQRANVEDLTDLGVNFALVVRGKTRDRLVYLRPDTRARMQEYVALGGETARDRDGTPLFSTIDAPRHRLTRTRLRAIIVRYLRMAGLKRPGISNLALRAHGGHLGVSPRGRSPRGPGVARPRESSDDRALRPRGGHGEEESGVVHPREGGVTEFLLAMFAAVRYRRNGGREIANHG